MTTRTILCGLVQQRNNFSCSKENIYMNVCHESKSCGWRGAILNTKPTFKHCCISEYFICSIECIYWNGIKPIIQLGIGNLIIFHISFTSGLKGSIKVQNLSLLHPNPSKIYFFWSKVSLVQSARLEKSFHTCNVKLQVHSVWSPLQREI